MSQFKEFVECPGEVYDEWMNYVENISEAECVEIDELIDSYVDTYFDVFYYVEHETREQYKSFNDMKSALEFALMIEADNNSYVEKVITTSRIRPDSSNK